LKPVLDRILYLAALNFLEKHMVIFYQGNYFKGETPANLIKETNLDLCKEKKDESNIAFIKGDAPHLYSPYTNAVFGACFANE
jgi:hypothetical protein